MRKKATLLIATATALLALLPAGAAANWTKNGAELTSSQTIFFTGNVSWESAALGSVKCLFGEIDMNLTAKSNQGKMQFFRASLPSTACEVGGLIGSLCGTGSLTKMSLAKNASVQATPEANFVDATEIELTNTFGSCLTLTLTGSLAVVPDKPAAISTIFLFGELSAGEFGNVSVSGTLGAEPEGVYGFK